MVLSVMAAAPPSQKKKVIKVKTKWDMRLAAMLEVAAKKMPM